MAINVREAWRGLNTMMGRTQKQQRPHSNDPVQFVSELNHFTLYNSSVNSVVQFVNELSHFTLYNSSMKIILPCTIRQ